MIEEEFEKLKQKNESLENEIKRLSKENHDIKDELLASRHKDEIKEKTIEEMNQDEKDQFLNNYFKQLGEK